MTVKDLDFAMYTLNEKEMPTGIILVGLVAWSKCRGICLEIDDTKP